MRILACLLLAALVSGCVPIGIRGTSMPFRTASYESPPIGELQAWSSVWPLRNGGEIAQAACEHRRHPDKQQRADLEADEVVYPAKTRQYGDCAHDHTDDRAQPTDPKQQICHATGP